MENNTAASSFAENSARRTRGISMASTADDTESAGTFFCPTDLTASLEPAAHTVTNRERHEVEKAVVPSEPPLGIEPRTSALRKLRSAPELRRPKDVGLLPEKTIPVKPLSVGADLRGKRGSSAMRRHSRDIEVTEGLVARFYRRVDKDGPVQKDGSRCPDNTFSLVVFDPPHTVAGPNGWTAKKYGTLSHGWENEIGAGFAECFRVLCPLGTLIFKWNEHRVPVSKILSLTSEKPLFGQRCGTTA